jgi:hypothetical protein
VKAEATARDFSPLAVGQGWLDLSTYIEVALIDKKGWLDGQLVDVQSGWKNVDLGRPYDRWNEVAEGSNIAALGDLLVFQGLDGRLLMRRRYASGEVEVSAFTTKGPEPMMGTKLAIAPLSTDRMQQFYNNTVAVFYQSKAGKLVYELHSEAVNLPESWPKDFPDITLPPRGSFAVNSVERDRLNSTNNVVDTMILYQDSSHVMKRVYTNGRDKWHMLEVSEMAFADPGTSISCTYMWPLQESSGAEGDVHSGDMFWCYFFEDGNLVRMRLGSGSYEAKEVVPVDGP